MQFADGSFKALNCYQICNLIQGGPKRSYKIENQDLIALCHTFEIINSPHPNDIPA